MASQGDPKDIWVVVAICAIALIVTVVRRGPFGRPRYVIDEYGERQRVISWNRGEPVYDPKTWQQRIYEEAKLRGRRRWALVLSAPFLFGPIWLTYYAFRNEIPLLGGLGAGADLWIAAPAAMFFIPAFVKEVLYQLGYQGMQGAKVLDKKPARPGPDLVQTQKAHGDARMAGEAEARGLLKSKR